MNIIQKPSPNHNARPAGVSISAIILHADASGSEAGTISWIQSPTSKVSYHYLIGRKGEVWQFVADDRRAWHAGVSSFEGKPDCNAYSIGVSFSNLCDGREPYTPVALQVGVDLCAELIARHPAITVARIATHEAIALPPGRKHDPGHLFPLANFLSRVAGMP